MRKLLILSTIVLAFFLHIPFQVFSQNDTTKSYNIKKTEVNIALANIFSRTSPNPYYYIDPYSNLISTYDFLQFYPYTKLIVGMKFHNKKGATRLGLSLHFGSNKRERDATYPRTEKITRTLGGFYVGYEWHSTFRRVNIFYGLDVSSTYLNYKANIEESSTTEELKIREFTAGINPLVGVNFFITPNLSIGTEARFIMEYVGGKEQSSVDRPGGTTDSQSESKSSGFRTRFGPLGLVSINIHF